MESKLPKRKHPRLKCYDYGSLGAYYITICTYNRRCILSKVVAGRGLTPAEIQYTEYGKIAEEQLLLLQKRYPCLEIDKYVIMPNHIHAVLILSHQTAGVNPRPTISDIVCAYKSLTTKACRKLCPQEEVFQTSFYEHVIRGRADYEEVARYSYENPMRWHLDKLYTK